MALTNGEIPVAQLLIDRGADPKAADWYGRTPLWAAVEIRNRDLNSRTLDQGIDRAGAMKVIESLLGKDVYRQMAADAGKCVVDGAGGVDQGRPRGAARQLSGLPILRAQHGKWVVGRLCGVSSHPALHPAWRAVCFRGFSSAVRAMVGS